MHGSYQICFFFCLIDANARYSACSDSTLDSTCFSIVRYAYGLLHRVYCYNSRPSRLLYSLFMSSTIYYNGGNAHLAPL
ncbi:hypothetical protein BO83DRAFT_46223 [Aspergillus eucalypticola CBS 122712]|uniref:Uncharacterized protein n=1 Tax=Aspergillus eucalypticola (strain CBS 122712 / IBT 29274) TaxID=1448314 RepID=A0A317VFJ7_ASPEC|nr:uncharacterized protein BO83DRAFT_46223 [Aspergillus eucalypticola CBS 122712]PWY71991.1 hypothetical protein BO83DRAFT_46223 [Aspergillus eucalypticola CBS 122712]